VSAGVGDIHPALYAAYAAHHGAFRDITAGRNGHQKDIDKHATGKNAAELPVDAQKGYDAVTGLGAPLWPAVAAYLFDPAAATATASLQLAAPHSRTHPTRVRAKWGAKQVKRNGSLAASAAVTVTRLGAGKPVFHTGAAAATGTHTFKGVPGATYSISVTVTDFAGHTSPPTATQLTIPIDDSAFTFHGPWASVRGSTDFGGSRAEVDKAGAAATVTATGALYGLEVRTGPSFGKLAIFRGAKKIGTYDLYSKSVKHAVIPFYGTPTGAVQSRRFTIYAAGRKNPQSTSRRIDVDALVAVPAAS
jgi:hypothetical protein